MIQCKKLNPNSFHHTYRISGVMCIIVTDRDGTPVLNVKADSCMELGVATKPSFIATYTMATDQASKLGLGKNQSIVCMYSNYTVIVRNFLSNLYCNSIEIQWFDSDFQLIL